MRFCGVSLAAGVALGAALVLAPPAHAQEMLNGTYQLVFHMDRQVVNWMPQPAPPAMGLYAFKQVQPCNQNCTVKGYEAQQMLNAPRYDLVGGTGFDLTLNPGTGAWEGTRVHSKTCDANINSPLVQVTTRWQLFPTAYQTLGGPLTTEYPYPCARIAQVPVTANRVGEPPDSWLWLP